MLEIGIIVGSVVALILISIVLNKILDFSINRVCKAIDKKRRKEHPTYFLLQAYVNELGIQYWEYERRFIRNRKERIETLLDEYKYYPAVSLPKVDAELEELRMELNNAMPGLRAISKELDQKREELNSYIAENNIKWG